MAGQYCLRHGDTLHILKIGYNEDQHKIAPGSLLLEHRPKKGRERFGVNKIDIVTDQAWHRDWKPVRTKTWRLYLFSPGLRGLCGRLGAVSLKNNLCFVLDRLGLLETAKRIADR